MPQRRFVELPDNFYIIYIQIYAAALSAAASRSCSSMSLKQISVMNYALLRPIRTWLPRDSPTCTNNQHYT